MKRWYSILVSLLVLCMMSGIAHGFSTDQLNLDFYAGWQGGDKQSFSVSTDQPNPGALFRSAQFNIPNRGLWLGAGLSTGPCSDYRLFVQGWYFFPSNARGTIVLDPGATPRQVPADIKSHLDWWYVDIFGTRRVSDPFSFVLGVRVDHHDYYTDDPGILNLVIPVSNRMRYDLNVLTTIPYFGFQWGPSYGLTLRAVYSPVGWIDVKSTLSQNNDGARPVNWLGGKSDFSKKQFFELFAEYTREVSPSMQLGVFARGTWLNATASNASISETLVNASATYDASYQRSGWTVGGSATVRFDTPQLLSW